jgi:DNA invertase Pin-like site-specific DNA recombinase
MSCYTELGFADMTPKRRRAANRDITQLAGLRVGLYCRVSVDTEGTEKSVNDQEAEGRGWVKKQGAVLADNGVYRDSDRSASRYATREREEFTRLEQDIEAGALDVVWFWEQSRITRDLGTFARFRDLCRDRGVLVVIREHVYQPADPAAYSEMFTLAVMAGAGEMESGQTSERVRRGVASNAMAGKPHSFAAYGYRRIYDTVSRHLIRQEPDADGADSPAEVVREIFERFAAGASLVSITQDLNRRGIPTAKKPGQGRWKSEKPRWWPGAVRQLLLNPVYIGRRTHQGEVLDGVKAILPP